MPIFNGNNLANTITGTNGADTINGNGGADTLSGGNGADVINGGNGADTLNGNAGNDVLNGDAGADSLFGGNGADVLTGGAGRDTLTGGNGADTFTYTLASQSAATGAGVWSAVTGDSITDFNNTVDKINFSDLEPEEGSAFDRLTWSSSARVNGVWTESGFIYADTSGDGTADLAVRVQNSGNDVTVLESAVLGVNHGPVVEAALTASVTEDDTATTVDLLTGAADIDEDTLSVTDVTYTVDGAALEGTPEGVSLTEGGTGLVIDAQNDAFDALGAGETQTIVASYTISDGHGGTVAQTATVTVTGVNDAPTGEATAILAAGTEDTAYTLNASDLLQGFSDVDGDTLSVADVSVTNGVVTDNEDGTFTVTPDANFNGEVTVSYNVVDGNGGSVAASNSFTIDAVNDAPTGEATAILAAGTEDTAYTLNASDLLQGFSDVDGDTLSVADVSVTNGVVTDNEDGTFTVTPDANFNGEVTVSYNVVDGNGGSVAASNSFTINAVNDAPTGEATAILAAGTEDTAYTLNASDLLQGFSDVDGDTLSVADVSVTNGVVTDNEDGTFTVTPDANFNGEVTVNYNVVDGNGGSVAASNSFTINAVNDAPTGEATAILAAGTEDTAYTLNASDLLQGFSDVDGDTLSVADVSVTNGVVTDNEDGTFTVTPDANFNGEVTVSYNVVDGNGGSVAASNSFTINAVNDAPTGEATAILAAGTEDTAYTLNASDLLQGFSDVDGDTLSVADVLVNDATVTDNEDGTFTVTPDANFNGEVTVSYNVVDGNGGSVAASNSFTINAVNDAPTGEATAILAAGTEDTAYTLNASDLLQGFSDVDGDTLSVADVSVTNGVVTDNEDGTFTVTPDANFNGEVTVSYNVVDGNGGSVAASNSFTINAVNDAPTGEATAILAAGTEDTAYTLNASDLLQGFSDVDGDTLSVADVSVTNGVVTDNEDGTFTVTPDANFNGEVTVSYNVVDGNGGSVAASNSFTINAVNDAPTGEATAILAAGTEDTAYTLNASDLLQGFSDVDGDTLSVADVLVNDATVTDNEDGTFTVTPDANFNGEVTVNYNVVDGNGGSVAASNSFTINAVNDAPTGEATAILAAGTEDTAYTLNASDLLQGFSDVDGDTLSVADVSVTNGVVTDNEDGTFTVTPDANFNGEVTVSYNVVDGNGGSVAASNSFTIDAVNDAPVITSDEGAESVAKTVDENTTVVATITATDVEGSTLNYVLGGADAALFNIDAGGQLSFISAPNFEAPQDAGSDNMYDVSVVVSDGDATDTQTFAVSVNNLADEVTDINFTPDSAAFTAGNVTAGLKLGGIVATDADSANWTYTLSGDAGLSFMSAPGATVTTGATLDIYAGSALNTGNYTATITAADSEGNSYAESFNVKVGGNGLFGTETLGGSVDSDWIFGRNGADTLNGNNGDDSLSGGAGNDTVNGGQGADALFGGAGADTLSGGLGNDALQGGTGADLLNGGLGNDELQGGAGADSLNGGQGNDVLLGGSGSDAFVLSSKGALNQDVIQDFDGSDGLFAFNQDVIQLKGLVNTVLANGNLASANFKSFSGTGTFDANDYVQFDTASGNLYIDLDGNGILHNAEHIATVTLTAGTLGASDFEIIS